VREPALHLTGLDGASPAANNSPMRRTRPLARLLPVAGAFVGFSSLMPSCGNDERMSASSDAGTDLGVGGSSGSSAGQSGAGGSSGSSAGTGGSGDGPVDAAVDVTEDALADASGEAAIDAPVDATSDGLSGLAPDFALEDVNPNSSTYQSMVSPSQYLGQVSAWYFGHAT
jgi:hypothetical protein